MNDVTSRASTRKGPDHGHRLARGKRRENNLKQTPFSQRLGANENPI